MSRNKPSKAELHDQLPWYVNGSLEGDELRQVESWLRSDEEAWSDMEAWQALRQAARRQPEANPPDAVRARLLAQVQSAAAARRPAAAPAGPTFWGWRVLEGLAGLALTLLVLGVLWWAVRPGVVLQWGVQAQGAAPASFRIFRAPAGTQDFVLLANLPARAGQTQFSYVDAWLLPGVKYLYRVEGVGAGGVVAFSQVDSDALAALPGQLAILITSLIISYSVFSLLQHWLELRFSRRLPMPLR